MNRFKHFILVVISLLTTTYTWAYDFSVTTNSTTLFYSITSNTDPYTVKVTSELDIPYSYTVFPAGDITIPSTVTHDGITYSVTQIDEGAFCDCPNITSISIPNTVTQIENQTFSNCTGLTSISLPNTLKEIGEYAFYGCASLKSFIVPDSVTIIKSFAFANCQILTSFTFGQSVQTLEICVFEVCDSLYILNLPASLTTVRDWSFMNCKNLREINVDPGNTHFTSINGILYNYAADTLIRCPEGKIDTIILYDSVKVMLSRSCMNAKFNYILLPASLLKIEEFAFARCFDLKSIDIPNAVNVIEVSAFQQCSGLETISLGKSINFLGNYSFSYCYSIKSITSKSSIPPQTAGSTFSQSPTDIILYVPCNTKNIYGTAPQWENFTNIRDTLTYDVTLAVNNDSRGTVSLDSTISCECLTTSISATANPHCYFLHWADGDTSNPRTITVFQDTVFTAIFGIDSFNLNININLEMGSVSGSGRYEYAQMATLSVTPKPGYQFVKWNDGISNNPRTVIVTQDTVFTAEMSPVNAITNINNSTYLQLFPNPVNDVLHIDNINEIIHKIRIYNVVGKEIKYMEIMDNKAEINMNDLRSGIYFIHIASGNNIIIRRIFKL